MQETFDDSRSVWNPTATTNVAWDAESRLTGITYPNSSTNSFVYNGIGQRTSKTDSTGTKAFTFSDDAIDSSVVTAGTATFEYGLGLISEVQGGATKVFHVDGLGTSRARTNSSQTTTDTLETDAFGLSVASSGTGTAFGFAGGYGYQSDGDSGLMLLGHRYYDPSTGRFLSRDPIRDGYNWYAYCENDPVNTIDPTGLSTNNGTLINNTDHLQWGWTDETNDIKDYVRPYDPKKDEGVLIPGLPVPDVVLELPGHPKLPGWRLPKGQETKIMIPVQPGKSVGGPGKGRSPIGLDMDGGWDPRTKEWVWSGGKDHGFSGIGTWERRWSRGGGTTRIFWPSFKWLPPAPPTELSPNEILKPRYPFG